MESLLELNDHLSQLEETFEKQRVVQTQLQFQGEDLQRKITIKVADNKLLEVKKHHQDMQIKELRKELEHLQDTLPGYELDEKALKSELDLISKEKSNYIESENEIKLQLNESVKVIKNIKEHNRSLRQKVSEIEIDINDDIYKIVNITEKHENLMHQYYRELEESRAITEKLESLKRNVMDIQDTERRQAYELNDIEQKLTENQAKIEALKLGKIKYIDIKNHLKSQIQSAERDFKDIQSEEDSLNGLISESNSKCHDLEMKLSKKIKNDSSAFLIDINFLDNKISETERWIGFGNNEKAGLIEENLEIQKQTKLANDDARHQKSVIESLTLTLNELQKHHNKLESYFKRKQSQRHQRQIAESELNLAIDSFTSLI